MSADTGTAPPARVALVGATGFVGAAVAERLHARGVQVVPVRAPRLLRDTPHTHLAAARTALAQSVTGAVALVNAAGLPDATGTSENHLDGANAVLPGLLAAVAREAGVRFVHVSSAAVQGRSARLDDSPTTRPFSAYSRSKAAGEAAVLAAGGEVVILRPAGVHGPDRNVTRSLTRLAASPRAVVAAPGTDPSPQALLRDVADAVAFLALCPTTPPRIVTHPASGVTTAGLLRALGGREPRRLPRPLVRGAVALAFALARVRPELLGHARRLEMLCLGQPQAASWLQTAGWTPVEPPEAWAELGQRLRTTERDS